MENDPILDKLKRDPKVQESFTIAARRAKRIHDRLTEIPPIAYKLKWLDAAVAAFCLFLGWRWGFYIIAALVFCTYLLLHRILAFLWRALYLLFHIHQQLIYLAQKRHDLPRETLGYIDYFLEEYARDGGFQGEASIWRCQYAFTEMLEARLREEGLRDDSIGHEMTRYRETVGLDSHHDSSPFKNYFNPYTDKDL